MATHMLTAAGRAKLTGHLAAIAAVNGVQNAAQMFTPTPTAEQRLVDKMRESAEFMQWINLIGVDELIGSIIGLNADVMTTKTRRSDAENPRAPAYYGTLDERGYQLYEQFDDSYIPWEKIDQWAKFPNFAQRYAAHVARSVALSRMKVGFHGIEYALDSDDPMGADVNIGWLQKLRLEKADHVMGRATQVVGGKTVATGAAQPIQIGGDGADYQNIDALAYDLISGMPSWARNAPGMTVILSADLADAKYFPMINRALSTTIDGGRSTSDEVVRDIVMSAKQVGGKQAMIVPHFPDGTMFITQLASRAGADDSNLSIYSQTGGARRFIKDEPEKLRSLVDYNSNNLGYVIESTDHAVLAENITFGAPE